MASSQRIHNGLASMILIVGTLATNLAGYMLFSGACYALELLVPGLKKRF